MSGGTPIIVCDVADPQGMSWSGADDAIFFNPGRASGIRRVSAAGGAPVEVTKLEPGETDHVNPDVLPDGSAVLFTDLSGMGNAQIFAQSLKTGERHRLAQGEKPHYLPTGHITYVVDGVLYAVPFDAGRLEVTGQPVVMIEGIGQTLRGTPQLGFARAGTMAYVSSNGGPRQDALVWVDQTGDRDPGRQPWAVWRTSPASRPTAGASRRSPVTGPVGPEMYLLYDLSRETWNRFTARGRLRVCLVDAGRESLTLGSRHDNRANVYTSSFDGSRANSWSRMPPPPIRCRGLRRQ